MQRSIEGSMELDLFPAFVLATLLLSASPFLAFDAKIFKSIPKNSLGSPPKLTNVVNLRRLSDTKISSDGRRQ